MVLILLSLYGSQMDWNLQDKSIDYAAYGITRTKSVYDSNRQPSASCLLLDKFLYPIKNKK